MAFEAEISRKLQALEKKVEDSKHIDLPLHIGMVNSLFQSIPTLTGFWPFSAMDNSLNAYDQSGQGRTLAVAGAGYTITYLNSLVSYYQSAGASDYSRATEGALNITGYLTLGGWFYFSDIVTAHSLMGKCNGSNNGYWLYTWVGASNLVPIMGGGSGAAFVQIASSVPVYANTWYFIVGRFSSSTAITITVNSTTDTNTTAIPAALATNVLNFYIGRNIIGSGLNGRVALPFLSATYLSDKWVSTLYNNSRTLFGV